MDIHLQIAGEIADGKRAVFLNQELSHHLLATDLDDVLATARRQSWKSSRDEGRALGQQLYELLNGSGGQMHELIQRSYDRGEPLWLYFQVPFELDALPLELLYRQQFLLLKSETHLIRRVTDRNRLRTSQPEKRALTMLFMACSPPDLADSTLQFERQEEMIFREVEQFQVEMLLEDSGSLDGLEAALQEANGFDVVYLTGHAGHDSKLGPVFYMEDEIGRLDPVTPRRLADKLRDFPPCLLFLSGCSTGKADKLQKAESFAHQVVQAGVPMVLGWGLPVSDLGATRLTTELYKYLALGKSVDFAVRRARQHVEQEYHPWPLLRLFTDGSPLEPLIAPGQRKWPRTQRRTRYRALEDSRVRVLEYGFVGRRRQIQQGVRVLKGLDPDRVGLLIRGPAGVGKSCLAGKLAERVQDKELVVLHGVLNKAELLTKLRRLFDRVGLQPGLDVLQAKLEYADKIKGLCREAFKKRPTILVLDDLEQNLTRRGDNWILAEDAVEFLKPILEALPWCEGRSNLLITSRHPFAMEVGGRDLPAEVLSDITLTSFRGPDLEKKKQELPHIAKSDHSALYLESSRGNPLLLDWLEKIAEEEAKYDLDDLRKQLQGESEEFVREYLAKIMAETRGEAFQRFFRQAAVYRQLVPASAFATLGEASQLEVGVDLTLFEKEQLAGREPVYWVMPVIRDQAWGTLPADQQLSLHSLAYGWYDAQLGEQEAANPEYQAEAVHHALASSNIRGACKHAIYLGDYLKNLLLYRESVQLQQQVADRIDESVKQEAIAEKDENVSVLLNNLGLTWSDLGDAKKAIGFYEQALQIVRAVFGDQHPNVARSYNNLGLAWSALGDAKKAIGFYEQALQIVRAVFGDQHPNVARSYNNLGAAWRDLGDAKKAIGFYEQALQIISGGLRRPASQRGHSLQQPRRGVACSGRRQEGDRLL